jgi:hypothetical protein
MQGGVRCSNELRAAGYLSASRRATSLARSQKETEMPRSLRWPVLAGLLVAAMTAGCAHEDPQAPDALTSGRVDEPDRAPLFNNSKEAEYITGQYIVVFKDDVTDADGSIDEVEGAHGLRIKNRYSHAIKGFCAPLTPEAVEALRNDPRVAYIEQDQMARIVAVESNPTWGLDRIDQRTRPLDSSYFYNQTGAGVDVYCVDTGIRYTHSEFGGRAVKGFDATSSGGTAADGNGHGTHTAATIGGGVYGVAKGVRLISVRVLDNYGSGTYSQVIAGIDWITANHTTRAAVANLSLGGPKDAALDQAVRNSIADGVIYCVAAGNSTVDASTQSPANVAEAITVGATDNNDAFAWYSNYGSVVDIHAPGSGITSAYYSSDTAIATMSGTSMATPHVAGVVALYLETHPLATPAEVQSAILGSASTGLVTNLPIGTVNRLLYSQLSTGPQVVPSAPAPSSPWNGAAGVAVPATVSWYPSSGASSYRLQVSVDPNFGWTAYDQPGLGSTAVSVTALASYTRYYWRVNASNTAGTSGWSSVSSFTTGTVAPSVPPLAPALLSPANGSNSVSRSPTLQWFASAGATFYRLQVSTSPTFTTTVYDNAFITRTSASLSGLGRRVTYYWRVSATNSNGTGQWSATWSFRTRNQ